MKATELKALIIGVMVLALVFAFLIALFIIAFNIFLIMIPVMIVLIIIGYLFRKISPRKKQPYPEKKRPSGKYVDVEYKVKE